MASKRIVKLDVGGQVFKTSVSTLTQHDSMLKTMFTTGVPVRREDDGSVFIDRDPKHFRLILNFLRDGQVTLPDSSTEIKEILAEATYFLLEPLIELCLQQLGVEPKFQTLSTVAESRKLIFGSEKPIIMLQMPVHLVNSGMVNYYFSEQKFQELAEKHHESITFLLVTEAHSNESSVWSFFLKTKKLSAFIKGPADAGLLDACVAETLGGAATATSRDVLMLRMLTLSVEST